MALGGGLYHDNSGRGIVMADRAYQRRELCGEVTSRIRSELQTKTTASEMTLARFLARKAIKAEWQRAGIEVAYVDGKDLNIAAWEYLHEHLDELIGLARAELESDAQKPEP
jgi:hypothetical protein